MGENSIFIFFCEVGFQKNKEANPKLNKPNRINIEEDTYSFTAQFIIVKDALIFFPKTSRKQHYLQKTSTKQPSKLTPALNFCETRRCLT